MESKDDNPRKNDDEKEKKSPSEGQHKEDLKKDEREWTKDAVVSRSSQWSLEGDTQGSLVQLIKSNQSLMMEAQEINSEMQNLFESTDSMSISITNLNSKMNVLGDSQFMENRVAEEEETQPSSSKAASSDPQNKEIGKGQLSENKREAVLKGFIALDEQFVPTVVENSDDSDDDDPPMRGIVLKPKLQYNHRPLPHLIGTADFFADDTLGLVDLKSDEENVTAATNTESSDESTEDLFRPYSRSEEGLPLKRELEAESEEEKTSSDLHQPQRKRPQSAPSSSQAHSSLQNMALDVETMQEVQNQDDLFDFQHDSASQTETPDMMPPAIDPSEDEYPKPDKATTHTLKTEDAVGEHTPWLHVSHPSLHGMDPIYPQPAKTEPKAKAELKKPNTRIEPGRAYNPLAQRNDPNVRHLGEKDTSKALREERHQKQIKNNIFEPSSPVAAQASKKPHSGTSTSPLFPTSDDEEAQPSTEDYLWRTPAQPSTRRSVESDLFSTTPGEDVKDLFGGLAERSTLPKTYKSLWDGLEDEEEGDLFVPEKKIKITTDDVNTKKPTSQALPKSSIFDDEDDEETDLFILKPTQEQSQLKSLSLFGSDDEDFFDASAGSSTTDVAKTSSSTKVDDFAKPESSATIDVGTMLGDANDVDNALKTAKTRFDVRYPPAAAHELELTASDDELYIDACESRGINPSGMFEALPRSASMPRLAPERRKIVPPSLHTLILNRPQPPGPWQPVNHDPEELRRRAQHVERTVNRRFRRAFYHFHEISAAEQQMFRSLYRYSRTDLPCSVYAVTESGEVDHTVHPVFLKPYIKKKDRHLPVLSLAHGQAPPEITTRKTESEASYETARDGSSPPHEVDVPAVLSLPTILKPPKFPITARDLTDQAPSIEVLYQAPGDFGRDSETDLRFLFGDPKSESLSGTTIHKGKLRKSQLININVEALLPGARATKEKKTDNTPGTSTEGEDEVTSRQSTPVPSVSVLPSHQITPHTVPVRHSPLRSSSSFPPATEPLKTLTKERAKKGNSRKPSTRKGRIGRMPNQSGSKSVERGGEVSLPSASFIESSVGDRETISPQLSSINLQPPPTNNPTDMFRPAELGEPSPNVILNPSRSTRNVYIASRFTLSSSSEETLPQAGEEEDVPNPEVPPPLQELPGNFLSSPFYDNQPPPLEVEEPDLFDDLFVDKSDEDDEDTLFRGVSSTIQDEPPPLVEYTSVLSREKIYDELFTTTETTNTLSVERIDDELFSSAEATNKLSVKRTDDELFTSTRTTKQEDGPSELFNEKRNPLKEKENPSETSVSSKKLSKSSLFGDDEEDDLFSASTSIQKPSSTHLAGGVTRTTKRVKLKAEEVKEDPLSLMKDS